MRFGISKGLTKHEAIQEILRRQQRTTLPELPANASTAQTEWEKEVEFGPFRQNRFVNGTPIASSEADSISSGQHRDLWPISPSAKGPIEPDYALWRTGEDPQLTLIGNPANRRLVRQHEREVGPWPRTDDGRRYDVGHIKAIADGGKNTLDNIRPIHPDAHRAEHMANGDFPRWARRASIARAFGGRVARGIGPLSGLSDFVGMMTGRIRTDNWDNFASGLMGRQSQEDFWREQEEVRQRTAPHAPRGTIFF